ncbi:E3 ubiquitin-protein ligase TRIM71 [Holothuria leucospilota]|uniref:E3 ubiquitin-protein ligase TRIM71 n=1 Tax=Holothuria leucospilota TaxID=206669 RepID=A0A9Q1CDU7_HOLLE|nr:E3 ubiquitin-protein ligase TRIM71 [Holothuria leucospilota]
MRECCGCSEKVKPSAYCFKCNDFLCDNCKKLHLSNKLLKDHKPYVTLLTKAEHNNVTLGLFNTHKEVPKCQIHSETASQLCCKSCGNLPICVPCSYGSHKNHDISDVASVVNSMKDRFITELSGVRNWKEEVNENLKTLKENDHKIISNTHKKAETLKSNYEKESGKVETTLKTLRDDHARSKVDIENNKKRHLQALQKQMEVEMQEIKNKYNKKAEEIKSNSEITLKALEKKFQDQENLLSEECNVLSNEFENSLKTLQAQEKELHAIYRERTAHFENTEKRLKNILVTGNSILEGNNSWTIVQCASDVFAAIHPVEEKMKKGIPKTDRLSQLEALLLEVSSDQRGNGSPVRKYEESVVDIEGINDKEWYVNSIAGTGDGNFVISGNSPTKELHITVVNAQGKRIRQKITVTDDPIHRWSYCDFLSKCKVVVISSPFKVGIYDIVKGTYFVSNITEVISNWPKDWYIRCVATEPKEHLIYVSSVGTKDVYVLNNQLNYQSQMRVPDMVQWPQAFKVSEGKLLLCGSTNRACAVDMKKPDKVLYEFIKPSMDDVCIPLSICVDKKRFIYILWSHYMKCMLVQYSPRGGLIKKTKLVDRDASCVAAVETEHTEKIIVATHASRKLYIYRMVE